MDDLFSVIGKLYVDVYNMQKVIEILQKKIKEYEGSTINQQGQSLNTDQDER